MLWSYSEAPEETAYVCVRALGWEEEVGMKWLLCETQN